MKIQEISSKIITPKTTGYTACTCAGLSFISGMSKNKSFRKTHKPFAILTLLTTALHIGLIEYYNHKFKVHNNQDLN